MQEENRKSRICKGDSKESRKWMAVGAGLGIALGASMGTAFGNIPIGVGAGVAIGTAVGMLLKQVKIKN